MDASDDLINKVREILDFWMSANRDIILHRRYPPLLSPLSRDIINVVRNWNMVDAVER